MRAHPGLWAAVALATLALATVALAGCTTQAEPPAPVTPTATAIDPTVCLPADLISLEVGAVATAGAPGTPPAGPIDAALAGTPRTLCTYDLPDGDRLGYTPLVKLAGDADAMTTAIVLAVGNDDCTAVSGYLTSGQNAYYVWNGVEFAAAYILVGDPRDPDAWLAKIIDDAGLCDGGDG